MRVSHPMFMLWERKHSKYLDVLKTSCESGFCLQPRGWPTMNTLLQLSEAQFLCLFNGDNAFLTGLL